MVIVQGLLYLASFAHSFNKYLLGDCPVLSPVLEAGALTETAGQAHLHQSPAAASMSILRDRALKKRSSIHWSL